MDELFKKAISNFGNEESHSVEQRRPGPSPTKPGGGVGGSGGRFRMIAYLDMQDE